jgi:HEAT repeat protein
MTTDMDRDLEAHTQEARNDRRTTHELVSFALSEPDENAAWEAIGTLHFRATPEVFDAAQQRCASACTQERALGANILGQLGVPNRLFPKQSVNILLKMLETEREVNVLDAICIALGHIHDPVAIPALARRKNHSSVIVRYAVVFGLMGFEDDLAIHTLIELSRDPDESVRDWATFGLGTQIDADTPAIRAALLARVYDTDATTRGEAMVGLAKRKHQRVVGPLINDLASYPGAQYGNLSVEAAELIADPRLLPILTKLKRSAAAHDATLDDAIRRCSGAASACPV